MPNAECVALLVARLPLVLPLETPTQLLPAGTPPILLPVGPPTPINGMPPPARTDAATCASRTPTPCAVMVFKRRV